MAMEINGLNSNQTNTNKARSGQTVSDANADAKQSDQTNTSQSGETVKISAEAQALNRLSQQLGSDAPVNQEKVEALRAALADGSYKVDAQSVARKMLESDAQF